MRRLLTYIRRNLFGRPGTHPGYVCPAVPCWSMFKRYSQYRRHLRNAHGGRR